MDKPRGYLVNTDNVRDAGTPQQRIPWESDSCAWKGLGGAETAVTGWPQVNTLAWTPGIPTPNLLLEVGVTSDTGGFQGSCCTVARGRPNSAVMNVR